MPGRPVSALNAERRRQREDPSTFHDRLNEALLVIQMTEFRQPPRDLAAAVRVATGDPALPAEEARRRGHGLKTWAKRAVGTSLTVHLLASGLGVDALVDGLDEQIRAVKLAPDGTVRTDPDGEPIPDLPTRRRALPLLFELLQFAGLAREHQAPDLSKLEDAARLDELEHGHGANGAAAAGG